MDVDAPLSRVWVEGAEAVAEELQGGLVVARRTLDDTNIFLIFSAYL